MKHILYVFRFLILLYFYGIYREVCLPVAPPYPYLHLFIINAAFTVSFSMLPTWASCVIYRWL